jgi:WhiB family redox-sensing transcriptional regulator
MSKNWRAFANCAGLDVELFFVEKGQVDDAVKKTCANCTVKVECATFAVSIPEIQGFWGGTTTRQRQHIRKGRQKIAPTRDDLTVQYR